MAKAWFDNQEQGKITLVRRDGSWYVQKPETEGDTICIFPSDSLSADESPQTHSVVVENYRRGAGTSTNYLTVKLIEDDNLANDSSNIDSTQNKTEESSPNSSPANESPPSALKPSSQQYTEQNLLKFSGSGEYVTIEAKIASIEFVNKESSNTPDMKGVLTERGSTKRVPFVVSSGVEHPYFEEGKEFKFEGIKDHRYEAKNEVQALITEHTKFTEL